MAVAEDGTNDAPNGFHNDDDSKACGYDARCGRNAVDATSVQIRAVDWVLASVVISIAGASLHRVGFEEPPEVRVVQVHGHPHEPESGTRAEPLLTAIRRELEPDSARPRYFITEAGMGHHFEG
ncbi:MAG TPA: hypothetical protein VFA94_13015 [Acidimicrobiales bacterium]|nr:hypothetical protein [Acidimicrobiales bacterium]